jgi:hypothetical protein
MVSSSWSGSHIWGNDGQFLGSKKKKGISAYFPHHPESPINEYDLAQVRLEESIAYIDVAMKHPILFDVLLQPFIQGLPCFPKGVLTKLAGRFMFEDNLTNSIPTVKSPRYHTHIAYYSPV